jgi:Zn-dependent protease
MRDQAIWSVSLGRWNGVQLRLHMLFLLFAAFTFYLSWLYAQDLFVGEPTTLALERPIAAESGNATVAAQRQIEPSLGIIFSALSCLLILFLSVLIHELGHVVAANRLGIRVDEMILGPLGGLGPAPPVPEPQHDLLMIAAGPLMNLGVCFLASLCLAIHGGVDLLGLMNPVAPSEIIVGAPLIVAIKMTLWINWLLVLVNLIPAYPFDGGRALRAAILIVRPRLDPSRAVLIVAAAAKVIAVGLLIIAWIVRTDHPDPNSVVQTWFALVLLSIFVFFSARKAESVATAPTSEEAFLGYDFSEGYTSLERSGPKTFTKPPQSSLLVRWWQHRREQRAQRQREIEAYEDGRVDEILLRVHEAGYESLTSEERALLRRASARYRSRPR